MNTPRFNIGTTFRPLSKPANLCTVTDILTTYNLKREVVKVRYVATHEFCGQNVENNDINETTIARGLVKAVDFNP